MPNPSPVLNATARSRAIFERAMREIRIQDDSATTIYQTLRETSRAVSFGDHLRRYLYHRAELTENFADVPVETYQKMILAEFGDRQVPAHFEPSTASLRKLSRNWLTQRTVSRHVVLLLGFGLGMSLADVNIALTKGLLESELNPKDPRETICWYCYRDGYGWDHYEVLWERYLNAATGELVDEDASERTDRLRRMRTRITDDKSLMHYLHHLSIDGSRRQSVTARRHFDRLYAESLRLTDAVLASDDEGIHRASSAATLEDILYASVPKNAQGNLKAAKETELGWIFTGKRLTRQRVSDILTGNTAITRYDLITLSFFVLSCKSEVMTPTERAQAFSTETSAMLRSCGMRPLYPANPYESFLSMCMETEDPLFTFADVLELCDNQGKAEGEAAI